MWHNESLVPNRSDYDESLRVNQWEDTLECFVCFKFFFVLFLHTILLAVFQKYKSQVFQVCTCKF